MRRTMTQRPERLLTPKQFAELVGVSPRTVVRWINEGKIKGRKIGRVWRITQSEWDRLYEDGLL